MGTAASPNSPRGSEGSGCVASGLRGGWGQAPPRTRTPLQGKPVPTEWPWLGAWPPLSPQRPAGPAPLPGGSREPRATFLLIGLPGQAWLSPRTLFFLSNFQELPSVKTLNFHWKAGPSRERGLLTGLPPPGYWAPRAGTGTGALSRQHWPWGQWPPPSPGDAEAGAWKLAEGRDRRFGVLLPEAGVPPTDGVSPSSRARADPCPGTASAHPCSPSPGLPVPGRRARS